MSVGVIAALEGTIGLSLPQDVRDYFRVCNGQSDESAGAVFGLQLLSTQRVKAEWEFARTLPHDGQPMKFCSSQPKNAVQLCQQHPSWIPLIADWSGGYIGIDLAPAKSGKFGQVINFGKSEDDHFAISPSWHDFLLSILEELVAENVEINTKFEELEFSLAAPPNEHFGDVIRELYRQFM